MMYVRFTFANQFVFWTLMLVGTQANASLNPTKISSELEPQFVAMQQESEKKANKKKVDKKSSVKSVETVRKILARQKNEQLKIYLKGSKKNLRQWNASFPRVVEESHRQRRAKTCSGFVWAGSDSDSRE